PSPRPGPPAATRPSPRAPIRRNLPIMSECAHGAELPRPEPVPLGVTCAECLEAGPHPVPLRLALPWGSAGCRDSSPPRLAGGTWPECLEAGTHPVQLRLCLTCGHVGCCDSSPLRHATGHFRATGHPVMRSFETGESWRWCFEDGSIV